MRAAPAPAGNKQIGVTITVIKDRKTVAVSEDPALVTADQGAITWNLPKDGSYFFPRDGIVIHPGNFSPLDPSGGVKCLCCGIRGHNRGSTNCHINVNIGTPPVSSVLLL